MDFLGYVYFGFFYFWTTLGMVRQRLLDHAIAIGENLHYNGTFTDISHSDDVTSSVMTTSSDTVPALEVLGLKAEPMVRHATIVTNEFHRYLSLLTKTCISSDYQYRNTNFDVL